MRARGGSNHTLEIVVAAMCLGSAACEGGTGGAAELSWKLRPASSALEDKFVDCESGQDGTGPVDAIRLHWDVDGDIGEDQWSCGDSHGVTGFALPSGSGLFWVEPLCEGGPATPASYIAPAVERRSVISGDTVSLGTIELVVQVSDCTLVECICAAN